MILPGFPTLMNAPGGFGIGSEYEGGFYVGDLTIGGEDFQLIIAPNSTRISSVPWNTVTTSVPGARSETDGQANTNAVMAAYPQNVAAAHCNGLSANGYTDWYWPSKDELVVAGSANGALPSGEDFGGNSSQYYWSSTEAGAPTYANAHLIRGTGALFGTDLKTKGTGSYFVRAMRRVSLIGSPNQDFIEPSISMTAASFFSGAFVGYIRAGSSISGGFGGVSGGSITSTLLAGHTTDSVFYTSSNAVISVIFAGDATVNLVGLSALKVNSTLCPVTSAPSYDAGVGYTSISFDGTATFSNSVTYTLQLI